MKPAQQIQAQHDQDDSMSNWNPIDTAPKDGTPVRLMCESQPSYGEHLMKWSKRNKRWECKVFAIMRAVTGWWDEAAAPPTHWQPA